MKSVWTENLRQGCVVDPKRVAVMGHSYGALRCITKCRPSVYADKIKAPVNDARWSR